VSSNPTPSPAVPEFPQTAALLALMIILLCTATLITRKRRKNLEFNTCTYGILVEIQTVAIDFDVFRGKTR
jgi:LPXTG-motif cell wall-anchored protein